MKIKNRLIYAAMAPLLFAISVFTACEETDYLKFDLSHSGLYFTKDTLSYSFGVTPVEIKRYTYNVPVRVMGGISNKKRTIGYAVRTDSTTAIEGLHYEIGEACIMPDSIDGIIPVTIFRENLEGNHTDGYKRYKLCLELVDNEHFSPTLDSLHQVRVLRFDNAVEQPQWYNAHGEKVWYESELGVWHPYKFIKMVEYFHGIEDILPETYAKMVIAYGENLEHIPLGSVYEYRTVFTKYIYYPMYQFFSDPANREYILSEYPDFPFDFPNPYAGGAV